MPELKLSKTFNDDKNTCLIVFNNHCSTFFPSTEKAFNFLKVGYGQKLLSKLIGDNIIKIIVIKNNAFVIKELKLNSTFDIEFKEED